MPLRLTPALCLGALVAAHLLATGPKTDEGVRLFETARYGEARVALEAAVREDPTDARAALYLGRALLALDDLDKAVLSFEKAVALAPGSSDSHNWLGRAYGSQAVRANFLKQVSLAPRIKEQFQKAVDLDQNNLDARTSLMEFYLQAPGIAGGSVEKAREQATEIARRDTMRGFRAAGRIAEYEKNFDAALAHYTQALKEYPGRREPYLWMTGFYSRQKQYGKALDAAEKMITALPAETAIAWFQIGSLAALSGERLERGEECFKHYLASEPKKGDPSLASAHTGLGRLYEKKGNKNLARLEYETALKIDPSLRDAREALKKLS
jgi:tetratricopeptide (TPR) repeat protein